MRLLYSETHPQHHHVIMGSILALNLKALDFCYHPSGLVVWTSNCVKQKYCP